MKLEKIVLHNLKVLKEYQVAKHIKNAYLSCSSFRSNLSRGNLPNLSTIIKLCNDFNIDSTDFCTKELHFELIFTDCEHKEYFENEECCKNE